MVLASRAPIFGRRVYHICLGWSSFDDNLTPTQPEQHRNRAVTPLQTAGDPDLLFKALDALVDNAIKFNASGGTIHTSLNVLNEIVCLKIADSGAGIPAHQLPQIWKPQPRNGGSGPTDLAEVKRIVEGHGGQVWAESTPGQGSEFFVALRKPDPHNTA